MGSEEGTLELANSDGAKMNSALSDVIVGLGRKFL